MEHAEIRKQNQRAWNEVAPRHAAIILDDVRANLRRATGHYVLPALKEEVEKIGLRNKTVVQFNCNNARELISLVQLGAKCGIGFDFSNAFVKQARALVEELNIDASIIESDIFHLGNKYQNLADILLITSGALCWMTNLDEYFRTVCNTLKPGGSLVIHETHPFLEMFKLDREIMNDEPLVPAYSYFMTEPVKSHEGLDYYGHEKYGTEIVYWYHHNLTSIMRSVIGSGLTIEVFRELEDDLDSGYARVSQTEPKIPMSYILVARK